MLSDSPLAELLLVDLPLAELLFAFFTRSAAGEKTGLLSFVFPLSVVAPLAVF